MLSFRQHSAITRFLRTLQLSSLTAKINAAVAPNSGPTLLPERRLAGKLSGRNDCPLSRRKSRIPAGLLHVRTMSRVITLLMLSVVLVSFVASAGNSPSNSIDRSNTWASYIAEGSQRFGVPGHWIRAVMQQESNGDKTVLSPKGAMGLMQIMPETYAELRLRYHLGDDPYTPHNNILAGAAYLRELHDRFGTAGFLAAYNAGPGRYEDYVIRGRPLPDETQNYVAALAPILGVPTLARAPESASFAPQSPTLAAAYDDGAHSRAPSENRFSPKTSPFQIRPATQARILFANVRVEYEATPASTRAVDMTALEPSENGALAPIFVSGNRLSVRHSRIAQLSLTPNGNALFAVQPVRFGK
jgi:hypothetical protein